jgi:hypothetical protein
MLQERFVEIIMEMMEVFDNNLCVKLHPVLSILT